MNRHTYQHQRVTDSQLAQGTHLYECLKDKHFEFINSNPISFCLASLSKPHTVAGLRCQTLTALIHVHLFGLQCFKLLNSMSC